MISMKRLCVLIWVFLLFSLYAEGRVRTNYEMINIAKYALYGVSSTKAIDNATPKLVRDNKHFCVYAADGHGFVVVNRNYSGKVILGLSKSNYDADNIPDGLRWWLESTELAMDNGITLSFYADVLNVDSTIDNFVTTQWGQGAPFNDKCPKIIEGLDSKKAPAGCVATALSQVMNYFKYPAQGKGESIFYITSNKESNAYKIDINGTYSYNTLKDIYSSSETDKDAISTLLFEAGAACRMSYTYSSSGATYQNTINAIAYNFSYDSLAINLYHAKYFTEEEWFDMIKRELTAKRPVMYSGVDPSAGGHSFLFTGLNTEGMVYVNWGWNGNCDGWFAIDHLVSNSYNFMNNQSMIIGFVPCQDPASGEENTSLISYGTDGVLSLLDMRSNVYLNPYEIGSVGWRWFDGEIRIALENIGAGNISHKTLFDGVAEPYFHIDSPKLLSVRSLFKNDYPEEFPAGDYKLWIEYKSDGEKEWKQVRRLSDFSACSWFSVKNDGSVIVDNSGPTSGIDVVTTNKVPGTKRVYDLNGRCLNIDNLNNYHRHNTQILIIKDKKDCEKTIVR